MGVLDSFKQDAFSSSQTVQVGNNQTPNQWAAEGHYPGKRTGRHLSGEQRESCCPWEAIEELEVFPEDDHAAQCVLTPPVTSLFCAVSILCATNSPRMGEEAPDILQQECDMCPSLLTGSGWWGQEDRALSGLTGAAQTLKSAPFPSVLPSLDDCSPRACLFFAELLRWVPVKNKACSPANLITSNKNLHSLDPEILTYSCKTQGKKQGMR